MNKGMTPIVRHTASLISGFVMLYGVYVVCTGHLAPGGGFAGGVIIMAGLVLLVLASGGDRAREADAEIRCHTLEGLGALGFALVALAGMIFGGFFLNFLPAGRVHRLLSGGTILASNIAIGLKVAAGLAGIFLALVIMTREPLPKD